MAVEILARALFGSGQASTVIAVELPATRGRGGPRCMTCPIDRDTA